MDLGIQKFKALLKTIETGSFTKTAELSNYTQSGISRMIAELENEWGITLLERNRGDVKLSSEGMEVIPIIEQICNEYEQLQNKISEIKGLESGRIRIGSFASVATHILPNIIRDFQNDFPNINYEIVTGYTDEIERWILEGRVDCGFVLMPCSKELDTVYIEEGKMLGIVPPEHELAKNKKIPLEELCKEPFLLLEKDAKYEISEIFEKNSLRPLIHYKVADDYAIMAMTENGLGVSILSELILKRSPYNIVAKELEPPFSHKIAFAVKNLKSCSYSVKKFMEYVGKSEFFN